MRAPAHDGLGAGWRPLLAALVAVFLAAGCAAPGGGTGDEREIRTASDQSEADKRARVRLELAAAYFSRGQYETALDEIKLAMAQKGNMPEAFNLRGLVYSALGEPRLAEQSFLRALQLDARDADTLHNYGWFLCQQGRFPEADTQFQRAVAQPQYRDAGRTFTAQGVCQARAGRDVDAIRTLSRAYELDPSNPSAAFALSEVLLRQGETERARFYIQRVNSVPEQSNAQTLWLAARIEQRLGNTAGAQVLGRQLRDRFPKSPEALLFEQGRLNE
jgi:type IV pilus assembly protein PilF